MHGNSGWMRRVKILDRLKRWARALKRDVIALWIAARDPRTPLVARIVAGATAAYALSPIDLIPDFVPVLGYVDDLLAVPLGIALAVRLIPAPLLETFREEAENRERPRSWVAAAVILLIWLAVVCLIWTAFPLPLWEFGVGHAPGMT